jgi:hypothetical protein
MYQRESRPRRRTPPRRAVLQRTEGLRLGEAALRDAGGKRSLRTSVAAGRGYPGSPCEPKPIGAIRHDLLVADYVAAHYAQLRGQRGLLGLLDLLEVDLVAERFELALESASAMFGRVNACAASRVRALGTGLGRGRCGRCPWFARRPGVVPRRYLGPRGGDAPASRKRAAQRPPTATVDPFSPGRGHPSRSANKKTAL